MSDENVPQKTPDGQYVLKMGDKTETADEQKLYQLAQLAYGANKKFEAASEMKKQAEQELTSMKATLSGMREALLKADMGDPASYKQILEYMGLEEPTREAKLNAFKELWASVSGRGEEGEEPPAPTHTGRKLGLDDLPIEVQTLVKALGNDKVFGLLNRMNEETRERDRNKVFEEMWKDVASDDKLATITKKGGARAEKLRKLSEVLIKSRIRDGNPYTATTRQEVVNELRALAEEFGGGAGTPTIPGLGGGIGLSQVEAQAAKEPERVSMTKGDAWETSVLKRMLWRLSRPSE